MRYGRACLLVCLLAGLCHRVEPQEVAEATPPETPDSSPAGKEAPPPPVRTAPSIWEGGPASQQPPSGGTALSDLSAKETNPWMRLRGQAGLGYESWSITTQSGEISTQLTGMELDLEAEGSIYNPRLATYNLTANFLRDGTTQEGGGDARTGAYGLGAALNLLSGRAFPVSLYYSRSRASTSGVLTFPITQESDTAGISGSVQSTKIAAMSYRFSRTRSTADYNRRLGLAYRQTFGNVSADRKLMGWDLRAADDYQATNNSLLGVDYSRNWLRFDGRRGFLGEKLRAALNGNRSSFSFSGTSARAEGSVLAFGGSLAWKHSERLESHYSAGLTKNAANTLLFSSAVTGLPGPGFVPSTPALEVTEVRADAGLTFRITPHWTLGGDGGYWHTSLPEAAVASLPPEARAIFPRGRKSMSASASYQRELWKLQTNTSGTAGVEQYDLLSGATGNTTSWGFGETVQTGDLRSLQLTASARLNRRTSPVFFNLVGDTDRSLQMSVETERLPWFRLRGNAERTWRTQSFALTANRAVLTNISLTATRQKVNLAAGYHTANGWQTLFALLTGQPGGSTGAGPLPIPGTDLVLSSYSRGSWVSGSWQARSNLRVLSQYQRNNLRLPLPLGTEATYWVHNTSVEYAFGRFTITGGFVRAGADLVSAPYRERRMFFRVRFPFQVLN